MNKSPIHLVVSGLLAVVVIVLALTNVLPPIGSGNYWWVVLAFVVMAAGVRLYSRAATGSWQEPRGRGERN